MPTIGTFHTFYWEYSDTVVTPVAVVQGGYPLWQSGPTGITVGASLWGWPVTVPALVRRAWASGIWWLAWCGWGLRLARRPQRARWRSACEALIACEPEQLAVVERALYLVQQPVYARAAEGVRQTATTLGFNRPQAWVQLSHQLKARGDWAENTWRHLHACALTDQAMRAAHSTVTNRDRHFAVALAYEGFVAHPKR